MKFVAFGWSRLRSLPGVRDQVEGALDAAVHSGWDGLAAEQREHLDGFWDRADVELGGDTEIQQAVRFGMFHVLQAGDRAEGRPVAAKGLTGTGYDGHAFWDTEIFVLPVLTWTTPQAAAHALRWRRATLPKAAERARQPGKAGAAFPWRTINGAECSSYWPASTAAVHINAAIADAVISYVDATGDRDFERDTGLELLAATARLWRSLGHHDAAGGFRIDGVTGPDEYSAVADNNVYTNLMAQRNLDAAADAAYRYPHRADQLGVTPEEIAAWRHAARSMFVPYDEKRGVHPRAEGFTAHEVWDFAYYERLTVRDSSLSACTQAVMAVETGHLRLAYDYLGEAAMIDLEDLQHNTRDGLHLASLAGAWIALVEGFGGMRRRQGMLRFAPQLPSALTRLAFTVVTEGRRLRVEATSTAAGYTLLDNGPPLRIGHHGQPVTLTAGHTETREIPALPEWPEPTQPPGTGTGPPLPAWAGETVFDEAVAAFAVGYVGQMTRDHEALAAAARSGRVLAAAGPVTPATDRPGDVTGQP